MKYDSFKMRIGRMKIEEARERAKLFALKLEIAEINYALDAVESSQFRMLAMRRLTQCNEQIAECEANIEYWLDKKQTERQRHLEALNENGEIPF